MIDEKVYEANGIKTYVCANTNLHTFSLCCYIKAGMLYDGKTEPGTAHMFEHMVFRNLKNKYDDDIYDLFVANKLNFNARTYNEFVQFEFIGLPDGFSFACEVVSKMFDDFTLPNSEYKAEIGRIKAEIREDSEKTTIRYFADSKVWHGTPLEGTICGNCAGLDRVSMSKLNEYKSKIISNGNFFFCVTGNVTDENVNMLLKSLECINVSDIKYNRDNTVILPADFCNRKNEIHIKNSDYYYVRISFDTDNSEIPLEVQEYIYTILFTNEDALVYKHLSEDNQFVYSFENYYEQYRNAGCLKLQFEVSSRKLYDAIEETVSIFNLLKTGNFSMLNAKNKLEMNLLNSLDVPEDLNASIAFENHIVSERKRFYEKFSSVTKADVENAAKKLFVQKNCVVALKGRKNKIDSKRITEIIDKLDSGDF